MSYRRPKKENDYISITKTTITKEINNDEDKNQTNNYDEESLNDVIKAFEYFDINHRGKISLSDGWVDIVGSQAYLKSVSIALYSHGNIRNHEEKRDRKLLLHKKEIISISRDIEEKGFTVVPTKVYLKEGRVKVEIAIAKGRKIYDKREYDKKKQASIAIKRAMKR